MSTWATQVAEALQHRDAKHIPADTHFDESVSIPTGHRQSIEVTTYDGALIATGLMWDRTGGIASDEELYVADTPEAMVEWLNDYFNVTESAQEAKAEAKADLW